MDRKYKTTALRIGSYDEDSLHVMLVTLGATVPFLPYVLALLVLVSVVTSILLFRRTREALFQHKRMFTIALAITGNSFLGAILALNYIGMLVCLGIFWVLTFATYIRTVMTKRLFERVQFVTAVGGIFVGIIAIVQCILNRETVNFRPTSCVFNANYLGLIVALSALMSLTAFFEGKPILKNKKYPLTQILFALSILICVVTVFLSESRSSLLGLIAGVTLYFLLKKRFIVFSVIVACGVSLLTLGYFYPDAFGWTNSISFVLNQRIGIWLSGLDLFLSNPIRILVGMGPMSYLHAGQNGLIADKWFDAQWLNEIGILKSLEDSAAVEKCIYDITTAIHSHNIYVDALVNGGIFGALCYLALGRSIIRHGNKRRRAGDKAAFVSVLVAVATVLVAGIVDVTIMWHQSAILFVLMCTAVYTDAKV